MPIAKGKTNASRVAAGDRILVRVTPEGSTWITTAKTGEGVTVARVTGKGQGSATSGGRMTYAVHTTAGTLDNLAPIQTMWLAPEDPAGVKRAHVEALAEDLIHPEWTTAQERTREDGPRGRFTLEDSLAAVGMTPEAPELKVPTAVLAYSQGLPVVEMAYSSLAAGVQVAPMGTPEPTPEDLSGLAVALVAEDLEALDPEEVRAPATHRVVPGDVVRIHRGVRLYEVLRVEEDRARNNLTGEVAGMTMARVAPCDPADERPSQWVHVDLLHVVPPVARLRTQVISHDVAISQDVVVVTGPGWDPARGEARRVALIRVDGTRVLAIFRTTVLAKGVRPVAVVRIGDSLVVDGRCYRVVWHGEPGEPILEPARWRDRLPA